MSVVTVDYEINIEAEGDELILQNISNILRTYKGENALNRDIGINPLILDSSIAKAKAMLIDDIIQQITLNEDRVEVVSVEFEGDPLSGILYPKVEVRII